MVETIAPPEAAPVALAELRAFLRIDGAASDAELAAQLRVATELCERYIGMALLERMLRETLAVRGAWQVLSVAPVRAVTAVQQVATDGGAVALAPDLYAIDIDAAGQGWVRCASGAGRIAVTYRAGSAGDWNAVPEPVRHGILRLAAHLRMDGEGVPPAAVTALWRPWRAMRLGAGAVR
ncbi:head-tail connector protein, partial [Sphingomonas sp. CCH9-E2]|uniref:head-tail connector protein n=2 Tax=unclassified Sphingomonas TaxID=196159 RepID=UPI000A955DCA